MIEEKAKVVEGPKLRLGEGPNQATFRENSDLDLENNKRPDFYSSQTGGLNTGFLLNPSDSRANEFFRMSHDEPFMNKQKTSIKDSSNKSLKSILKKKEKSAS